jgi:hypothetical protein
METDNPAFISKFYETTKNHLLQLPHNTTPIVGGHFNASIDVCDPNMHDNVMGPYGFSHSNSGAGEKLLDMACNCSLQASANYFKHQSYEKFYDLQNNHAPDNLTSYLSMNAMDHMSLMLASSYKPRFNNLSDHHATQLKLHLT